MKDRLVAIASHENCQLTEAQLDDILDFSGGDMRRAVTTMQSAHALSAAGPLSKEDLSELAGVPPIDVIENVWNNLTTFDRMQDAIDNLCAEGYSAQALLVSFLKKVFEDPVLTELCKAKLAIRIAEAEKNLIDGADEYLQIMTVCSLALSCMEQSRIAKQ